jgi:hypothetical protein
MMNRECFHLCYGSVISFELVDAVGNISGDGYVY